VNLGEEGRNPCRLSVGRWYISQRVCDECYVRAQADVSRPNLRRERTNLVRRGANLAREGRNPCR
jgi:hypothetical protein